MSSRDHWNLIYESQSTKSVGWYAEHLHASMRYVERVAPRKQAAIIDVGGGESTLVDDLLGEGCLEVTVLDISATALKRREGASDHWPSTSDGKALTCCPPRFNRESPTYGTTARCSISLQRLNSASARSPNCSRH